MSQDYLADNSRPGFPLKLFLFLWVTITVFLLMYRSEPKPLPYQFHVDKSYGNDSVHTMQVSVIGNYAALWSNQFLYDKQRWEASLEIRDTANAFIEPKHFQYYLNNLAERDIDGDGVNELILSLDSQRECRIEIYDTKALSPRGVYVLKQDSSLIGKREWDTGITIGKMLPSTGNGVRGLMLIVRAAHGLFPRGMVVINPLTGQELWHYWIACSPTNVDTLNILGDNLPEILIGSYGPANGAIYENTTDDNAYLTLLDMNGTVLWQKPWTGPYTGIDPYFVQSGISTPYIIALKQSAKASGTPNELLILDPRNGNILKSVILPGRTDDIEIFPWYQNNQTLRGFLVGRSKNEVGLYNEQTELVEIEGNLPTLLANTDINGDGWFELIGRNEDNITVVLDTALQIIANWPHPAGRCLIQYADSLHAIVWVENGSGVFRLIYQSNPDFRYWKIKRIGLIFAWFMVGLGTAFLVSFALFNLKKRKVAERQKGEEEKKRKEFEVVITYMNHELGPLLGGFGIFLSNMQKKIPHLNIDEVLDKVYQSREKFSEIKTNITYIVDSLKKVMNRNLLKKTSCDLRDTIKAACEHEQGNLTDVNLTLKFTEQECLIYADAGAIQFMLVQMLRNSINAKRHGVPLEITISSYPENKPQFGLEKWVHLDVEDNGKGIESEMIETMFKLGYTTSPDSRSGFGLFAVEKIVSGHDGQINVTSTLGNGTVFHIRFPNS